MTDLTRREGESLRQYILRIGDAVKNGEISEPWPVLAPFMNEQFDLEFGESFWRKKYAEGVAWWDEVYSKMIPDDYSNHLQTLKRDIQIERNKLQAEKIENNRWLREYARDELICEKIIDAIKTTPSIKVPNIIPYQQSSCGHILAFGDEHYGTEFKICGLYGETLNEYSPEIFERRMWDLLSRVVSIIEKERITSLNVFSMGDYTDGIIRVKQLMKLRYGVIEGTIKYALFLANWLNELSKYVRVDYQMVVGNHSELRLCGQPKGTFADENMGFVVQTMLESSLSQNPNFTMIKNPSGLIFGEITDSKVLGIHGEVKNMDRAIKDFSNTYNVLLDILIGGHMHHSKGECVGVNRDVVNVPSIIGIDDFSIDINRTSNAGASLFTVERGYGKVQEYNIKLK